jgi:glycosyltransferase involved in cell wall biosynthesis
MSTLALAVILKNEEHVIEKCVAPFIPYIDYWVLADNGSTDKSEELATKKLEGIPGEYLHHKWHDFSTNRNMCIEAAEKKAEYIIMMDADDEFVVEDKDWKKQLDQNKEFYWVEIHLGGIKYLRPHVIKNTAKMRYFGVLHEYLEWGGKDGGTLKGVHIAAGVGGSRSADPDKYLKDAEILLKEVSKDPKDTRNTFYLAQSYRDAGKKEEALNWYIRRGEMGGWSEEACVAFYEAGKIMEQLGHPEPNIVLTYLKAHYVDTRRAEPLLFLSDYFTRQGKHEMAYAYAHEGTHRKSSEGLTLFTDALAYNYRALIYKSVSGFYTNSFAGGYSACKEALTICPEQDKQMHLTNLKFYEDVLGGSRETKKES